MREGLPPLYPRLWRYAAALTGNRASADDLAQTTCLRALDKADQFQPGTHLDRWVFRIAHRTWLNELRANAVRRGNGIRLVDDHPLADPAPGAETNIFATEVFQQIGQLPEAQRAAVMLVYVEGFKYKEAAQMLEIPVGTVMSRLAAARKTLKDKLPRDYAAE